MKMDLVLSVGNQMIDWVQDQINRDGDIHTLYETWDWSQLTNPYDFEWKVGVTPLSNLKVILATWATYAITILSIKFFMSSQEPAKMRVFTAIHNLILCIWSLGMFVGGVYGTYQIAVTDGIDEIFCSTKSEYKGPLVYVMYLYFLSKFVELIDTVILAMKKKTIIFLHWYHHAIVMLMVWTWLEYKVQFANQGMIFNTLIHVFMYWYYMSSSLGYDVWYKKYITSAQIVQFMTSFLLSVPYVYFHLQKGCSGWNAFLFSMACNGSFLLLFIDFYRRAYAKKGASKSTGGSKTKVSSKRRRD